VKGWGDIDPNELVLTFGGLHICVQFGENRQRNATVRVTTHGQTDTQTEKRKPILGYYLSQAICYSYGADNKTCCCAVAIQAVVHVINYSLLMTVILCSTRDHID